MSFFENTNSCPPDCLDIGDFGNCDTVELGVTTDETGVHKVVYDNGDVTIEVDLTLTIGNNVDIPASYFNETKETIFQVKKPSGAYVQKTVNTVDYVKFMVDVDVKLT